MTVLERILGLFQGVIFRIEDKGLLDKLTTHFFGSDGITDARSFSKLCSFFSCLAEMLFWTAFVLCLRNSVR